MVSVTQNASPFTEGRTADVYRAAAELMVEKGFGGTSIGDIAKTVGMTKAGLYHHISGKQDMLYQIMKYAMDELERDVIAPAKSFADPEQRLREIIRLHIHGAIVHGLVFTVLMSEVNHLDPDQRKKIIKRKKNYHALVRGALQELSDQGRLRNLDVRITTMHIMNTLTGIARWYPDDFSADEELLIQQTVDYNMAAILKPKSPAARRKRSVR
jgi:AcrR family transcriptional regulator